MRLCPRIIQELLEENQPPSVQSKLAAVFWGYVLSGDLVHALCITTNKLVPIRRVLVLIGAAFFSLVTVPLCLVRSSFCSANQPSYTVQCTTPHYTGNHSCTSHCTRCAPAWTCILCHAPPLHPASHLCSGTNGVALHNAVIPPPPHPPLTGHPQLVLHQTV